MPWRLQRFQEARCLHFITFSCQHRDPLLADPAARDIFLDIFERTRRWYGFFVCGFVVMPEHVHLLISEPERSRLAVALQMLKQNTARKLRTVEGAPFWEPRYYDFNVWSEAKRIEKLRYIHRNPVRRGLVERPEDWAWSSFRHYATGADCVVEIESQWTERRRETEWNDASDHQESEFRRSKSRKSNSPPCLRKNRGDKDGAPHVEKQMTIKRK